MLLCPVASVPLLLLLLLLAAAELLRSSVVAANALLELLPVQLHTQLPAAWCTGLLKLRFDAVSAAVVAPRRGCCTDVEASHDDRTRPEIVSLCSAEPAAFEQASCWMGLAAAAGRCSNVPKPVMAGPVL